MDFDRAASVALLERTPQLLRGWLQDLPEVWLHAREAEGSWSAHDIVGHLAHGEQSDWIPRARIVLSGKAERRFAVFDREGPMAGIRTRTTAELLDRFDELRRASLVEMASWPLDDEQLERTGEHPEFGTVSLRQLLCTWVAHDLSHLAQIARVMARQLETAVGPWRAYLPLVRNDRDPGST